MVMYMCLAKEGTVSNVNIFWRFDVTSSNYPPAADQYMFITQLVLCVSCLQHIYLWQYMSEYHEPRSLAPGRTHTIGGVH